MDDELDVTLKDLARVIYARVQKPEPHRRGFFLLVFEEGTTEIHATYNGPLLQMAESIARATEALVAGEVDVTAFDARPS